jgi:hypothetical protein
MWRDLKEEIELELTMLKKHLSDCSPLRNIVLSRPPDHIESMALGAMLHAFYNGIENIFKRITLHCGKGSPRSQAWHRQLLNSMAKTDQTRPAVISETLLNVLKNYLNFRHFFRQAYGFQIKWEKMAALVQDCEKTLSELENELIVFLNAIKPTEQ